MKSIIDKLQSLSESRLLSEEEAAHLVKMNALYRIGAITHNELRIGLGGESIGIAGDQYVSGRETKAEILQRFSELRWSSDTSPHHSGTPLDAG